MESSLYDELDCKEKWEVDKVRAMNWKINLILLIIIVLSIFSIGYLQKAKVVLNQAEIGLDRFQFYEHLRATGQRDEYCRFTERYLNETERLQT